MPPTPTAPTSFNTVLFPADVGGCGHYRMRFPYWAIQTIAKNVSVVDSMKLIGDPYFFQDVRMVRLQRQVSDSQCNYFLNFLKPLSEKVGFWLVYEVDDVIRYEDIPVYNLGRHAYNNTMFFQNVKNMLNACDFLTVTTRMLGDYYINTYGIDPSKVLVIPNYLPRWWIGEAYDVDRISRNFDNNKDKPRIIFPMSSSHFDLNGVNNNIDDFSEMSEFIRANLKRYHFTVVGHAPRMIEDLIHDGKVEVGHGSDILNYPRELSQRGPQAIIAPLRDNVFNNCKCVVGDTRVQIRGLGVVPISSVCGSEPGKHEMKSHMECLSENGQYKKVTHYFKSADKEKLKKIITKNGYEISGTPYHKIKSDNKWTQFGDIKRGDVIQLQKFDISEEAPYVELKIPCLHTKRLTMDMYNDARNKENCPVIKVTESFAKLFGYILGDGYFTGPNGIGVTCCDRDLEVRDEVMSLVRSFGIEPKLNDYQDRAASMVIMNSKSFRMLWESLGFVGSIGRGKGSGKNMRVPDFIWNSRKSVVKNFIVGLFESDATVSETAIVFSAKSRSFTKDVQLLLLSLGIKSKFEMRKSFIGEKSYGNHCYLTLTRQWIDKYYEVFGEECFTSNFKKDRVKHIIAKPHSNAYKHQELLEDEVSSAMMYGEDYVYDICVEDTHSYVANGIFSHNSNIKLLEGWSLGIPVIAQDLPCYSPYTDSVFKNNNQLQNKVDDLFRDKKRYIKQVKQNRHIVDFGDNKAAPHGWWIEKNLRSWYNLFTMPQKTLKYDIKEYAKLMGDNSPEKKGKPAEDEQITINLS